MTCPLGTATTPPSEPPPDTTREAQNFRAAKVARREAHGAGASTAAGSAAGRAHGRPSCARRRPRRALRFRPGTRPAQRSARGLTAGRPTSAPTAAPAGVTGATQRGGRPSATRRLVRGGGAPASCLQGSPGARAECVNIRVLVRADDLAERPFRNPSHEGNGMRSHSGGRPRGQVAE